MWRWVVMAHHVNRSVVPAKYAELNIDRLSEDTTTSMTGIKKHELISQTSTVSSPICDENECTYIGICVHAGMYPLPLSWAPSHDSPNNSLPRGTNNKDTPASNNTTKERKKGRKPPPGRKLPRLGTGQVHVRGRQEGQATRYTRIG